MSVAGARSSVPTKSNFSEHVSLASSVTIILLNVPLLSDTRALESTRQTEGVSD